MPTPRRRSVRVNSEYQANSVYRCATEAGQSKQQHKVRSAQPHNQNYLCAKPAVTKERPKCGIDGPLVLNAALDLDIWLTSPFDRVVTCTSRVVAHDT